MKRLLLIPILAGLLAFSFVNCPATPRSLGVGGSWTTMATSDLDDGTYSGADQALSLSGMYYQDQFIFRAGMTPLLEDQILYNELLMGWVWGTDPNKPRLCTMVGGTVKSYIEGDTYGMVTSSLGVALAVEEGTLLYPNFTVMYTPATRELTWQGRIEFIFHVFKGLVNGGGVPAPSGYGTEATGGQRATLFPDG